jgi:DNA modification methylase
MILHGNATSALYRLAAADADAMIVDPPYAAKVHSSAISAGTGGAGVRKRDLGFGHLTPALMQRIAEYAAQVRRWSVVFTDVESVHLWIAAMQAQGVEYVRTVPWVRWSQPQMSGDRPPTGWEAICIFHAPRKNQGGGKMHWNGPGNRVAYRSEDLHTSDDLDRKVRAYMAATDSAQTVEAWAEIERIVESGVEPLARTAYEAKSLRGRDKYSCEKPLDLMLALVSDYSDPGECIFDPCSGMGTTALAARLLGREAFGLERVRDVASAAARRVSRFDTFVDISNVLSERDEERACRWALETRAEAEATPTPKAANGSDVKTWERAQRRLADVERLVSYGQ